LIEKYDTPHSKTRLAAAANNVLGPKPKQKKEIPRAIRRRATRMGNRGVNCQGLYYHRQSQPRGRGGMAYAADLRKT
jgi:hypothetical protein